MPSLSERLGANITTVNPNSRIAKALATSGVPKTNELMRILGLPRRKFDLNSYSDTSIIYAKTSCGNTTCQYCKLGNPSVRPLQNAMLIEAAQQSGGFFNVGVGGGKTLASMLMHSALSATQTVLLVPAALRDKTLNIDLPDLQKHFYLPPVYSADEYAKKQPGVYVIGYSELSQTNASDLLDKIRPDLIVADEAHNLRHRDSARTKRFLRFMRKNPCKFVAMTGSAVSRSIKDFAHLIELALGKNSPLPADYPSLSAWADCIDGGPTAIGALSMLCADKPEGGSETAREGFQRRFVETPGVIVTTESICDRPIEINELHVKPPAKIMAALAKLEKEWAWDGEEYTGALDIARLQQQITQGHYYRAVWPNGIPDREYIDKRRAWSRCISARLSHSNRVGQDSPALLEALAEAGSWTPVEYVDWIGVRDRLAPGRESVEIDQWLVDLAISWISPDMPGIIWCNSPVIGHWLEKRGIIYYGEGQDQELNEYADKCLKGLAKPQTIACSVQAHGTGKNLQAWSRNLVLYPMAQGALWEQTIGRTHRPGQVADSVSFDIVLASVNAVKSWCQAMEDAKLIEETTGQQQKLLLANICSIQI